MVFTIDLSGDSHMRATVPYGLVVQPSKRRLQFRAVHIAG